MVETHIYFSCLFIITQMVPPTTTKIHIYSERHKSCNLCMNIDKTQIYSNVNFNKSYWSITQSIIIRKFIYLITLNPDSVNLIIIRINPSKTELKHTRHLLA